MSTQNNNRTTKWLSFLSVHKVAVSLFLAAYGAVYLTTTIMTGWTMQDWGRDVTALPTQSIIGAIPRSYLNPFFFITALPALLAGTIALCSYCIFRIDVHEQGDAAHVALLLTVCGFTYQVIGAWPLGNVNVFPWEWQKQIIGNGFFFSWMLYLLSSAALLIGGISLYLHSRYTPATL